PIDIRHFSVGEKLWHAGIWEARGQPVFRAKFGVLPKEVDGDRKSAAADGFWPVFVDAFVMNGGPAYTIIYEEGAADDVETRFGLSQLAVEAVDKDLSKKGYRVRIVSGCAPRDKPTFAALWENEEGPARKYKVGLTWTQMEKEFKAEAKKDFHLVHASCYTWKGQDRYTGVWEERPGIEQKIQPRMTAGKLDDMNLKLRDTGWRHVIVSGCELKEGAAYLGVWEKSMAAADEDKPEKDSDESKDKSCGDATDPKGAADKPLETDVPVTGEADPRLSGFDDLMTKFVRDNKVAGASLAIARDGKLVYARGFGWSDREAHEPVQPGSLFRIASLSKPITGVAVLQLVEQGRLKLSDRVHELLGLPDPTDPRLREITVEQLLHHTAGWDSQKSIEPMFLPLKIAKAEGVAPPAGTEAIIRYMWKQPLDFNSGERYAYSNFGYCLLGRIIEKASGQPYGDYVREHVLLPVGATQTRLGKSELEGRAPGEVKYYDLDDSPEPAVIASKLGQKVPKPYGSWYLEAMDAHGGWIAPAAELVAFGSDLRDPQHSKLLKPESIATLIAPPAGAAAHEADGKLKATWYGCGFSVRPNAKTGTSTLWHHGALDGTSTLLVLRYDGLCWAALFNGRFDPKGELLSKQIDSRMHEVANAIKEWPEGRAFAAKP
ncbi:MAG TPA: serine hydrolase, partial [Planctomycetaceae bacterium]|nr:serine hydrolase [Planctomycetaceae bacterium]